MWKKYREAAPGAFTLHSVRQVYSVAVANPAWCAEELDLNKSMSIVFSALLALFSLPYALAQDSGWPRTLPLEQGTVTIYSPQVDEMSGDVIHFRAALAYRATAGSEPVFGAGWFESRVEIDASRRIVRHMDLKVTETRFPAGTADVQAELSAMLAQTSSSRNLDFSIDELEAALKTAEAESVAGQSLNTAPPQIVYRDHPALLISMDGEPVLREIENSSYEAVVNTPYPLIFDGRHYYLNAARDVWYRAVKATGPYQFDASPPAEIAAIVDAGKQGAADIQPVEPITAANAPEIVVSTEPAELIVSEGPAAFVPLVDDLLVLQNSDDDVFMHVSTQEFYIVLAGRWYHSRSLNGPWTYRPADELPMAFASIPQDSDQADSRVYVAGTQEARDAVLDAQVPQTAAVARGEVDIEVEYDGDPNFEPVDGADLVYANNTGSTVIQSNGLYYLVEDGVWYVSATPNGPWQVSDHRPQQVVSILPTSPVYNVKYVHVYDATPSVVYVGYTPGYTGSYVYRNTIFYGSGWYYPPWVSPYYYYPRHGTWGFNVSYNPWSGWNFGLSWGWGPFSFGYYSGGYWHHGHYWHHRHYGRWGPGRYRHRPAHHGRHGDRRHSYDRHANRNLYRDGAQRARIADTRDYRPRAPGRRSGDNRADTISASDLRVKADLRDVNLRANRGKMLADNGGNVYRRAERDPGRQDAGGNNTVGRSVRPAAIASSRQSLTRAADNRARQRASPEAGVPVRQSPSAVSTPVRRSQPGPGNDRVRQRPSQSVSAPVKRQHISRPTPQPQPQSVRNPGHNKSAPVPRAPHGSTQTTRSQPDRSTGHRGKRAGAGVSHKGTRTPRDRRDH
jgi:hypothetical protein